MQSAVVTIGDSDKGLSNLKELTTKAGLDMIVVDPRHEDCPLLDMCKHVTGLREELDSRKVVERAKGILMIRLEMKEAEAYLRLKLLSSHRNQRMHVVAIAIIDADRIFMQAVNGISPIPSGGNNNKGDSK